MSDLRTLCKKGCEQNWRRGIYKFHADALKKSLQKEMFVLAREREAGILGVNCMLMYHVFH